MLDILSDRVYLVVFKTKGSLSLWQIVYVFTLVLLGNILYWIEKWLDNNLKTGNHEEARKRISDSKEHSHLKNYETGKHHSIL
jgi:hypothetical protein